MVRGHPRISTTRPFDRAHTTLPLEVFTQRNFVGDFFRHKLDFTDKTATSRFVPGNVDGSPMACWKARGRLPISAN